jgi:hypothetical protein
MASFGEVSGQKICSNAEKAELFMHNIGSKVV